MTFKDLRLIYNSMFSKCKYFAGQQIPVGTQTVLSFPFGLHLITCDCLLIPLKVSCSMTLFEAAPMWLNTISIHREFLLLESRVFAVQSSEKYIWWFRVKSNRLLVLFAIPHTNTSESNWPFQEKLMKQSLNFKLSVCVVETVYFWYCSWKLWSFW